TLVAFSVTPRLSLSAAFPAERALPVSLALVFIGLLVMTARRKAVSQLIGLITLENGIFLTGLIATLGLPLFVEIGVFFDLLVAVGVTAVLTMRINEHFDTMNTDELRRLRGCTWHRRYSPRRSSPPRSALSLDGAWRSSAL